MKAKLLTGLAAAAISLIVVFAIRPAENYPNTNTGEDRGLSIETEPVPQEEHWHTLYVRDSCERCPQCCTRSNQELKCGNCPGENCKCFKDSYHVWRPNSWLPNEDHCANCPSDQCICIKDGNGEWMLNETIGE